MSTARELRKLLHEEDILIAPGAFSALTAKLVVQAGFRVVYATGAGIANNLLGLPDVGLVSFGEMREQVRYIVEAVDVPVIVDADTGYGNPLNVIRTVRELERLGAAAIQLEDQVSPKRCGHFAGKDVVSREEMISKIKAAVDTRNDPDLVVIARTDARAVLGLDEAIERAGAYAEAGADMTFVEAPRNEEELRRIPLAIPAPQVANMVEGGLSPLLSADELRAMGFKLVLHANCPLRAGILAIQGILRELRQKGTTREALDKMVTMLERNRVTDMKTVEHWERKYLKERLEKAEQP